MQTERIGARFLPRRDPVVDVPPMILRDRLRINSETLDRVDHLQHTLELYANLEA